MTNPNDDLAAELHARDQQRKAAGAVDMATDPPVSEPQRRAMQAAAHGKSTLGIPKKVGEEFVGKAHDASYSGYSLWELKQLVNSYTNSTDVPRELWEELKRKGAAERNARDQGVTASLDETMTGDADPASYVGKFVIIPHATLHGTGKLRGKVTRVLGNGKLEVRVAEGGYHEVAPSDVQPS